MANPPQHPLQKPKMRKTTEVLAPTDAKALIPRNFQTMAASTNEYVCCNKFPNNKGKVKLKISGNEGPAVISLNCAISVSVSEIEYKITETRA